MPSRFVSFSYQHPPQLAAKDRLRALVIDVRSWGNPHKIPYLRPLTGLDQRVGEAIKSLTSDYDRKFMELCSKVANHPGAVYLGCAGGRHRSVYLAEQLGHVFGVPTTHLGIPTFLQEDPQMKTHLDHVHKLEEIDYE